MDRNEAEALVRDKGPPEVRERLDAGVLPEEEFDHAVRGILFEPIESWPRWRKISKAKIARRARDLGHAQADDGVTFDKVSADEFSAEQWVDLKELRELLPGADIDTFWIVAACGSYERRFLKAAVRLTFAGREYVREVAL